METMTIRELRYLLFSSDMYAVIGADEMTNKEARDFLFAIDNQDANANVINNGTHLLVWGIN